MFELVGAVAFESFLVFGDSVFAVGESGFTGGDDGVFHGVIMG